jgi:TolB protein
MNADGTDKRQVTRDAHESESPAWSPDGTQIAYTLDNYAGHSDIYVINADGTNRRRLTTDGNASGPTWSPDGTQIAFVHHTQGGGNDLYLMAVTGGTDADGAEQSSDGLQRLTQTGKNRGVSRATWSPDGMHIACVIDFDPDPLAQDSTICIFSVQDALQKGGAKVADMQQLPRVGEHLYDRPAWSPDGSQIAFSPVVNKHRDIYIINADGTNPRQLTHTPDMDEFSPAWSPDGTQIVFQANPEAHWDIYVMAVPDGTDTDGAEQRRLTTDVANDTAPDWTR